MSAGTNQLSLDLAAMNLALQQAITRIISLETSRTADEAAFKALAAELNLDEATIAKLVAVLTPVPIILPPYDPQVQWKADMETGNLGQWSDEINSGSADSTVVTVASVGIPARVGGGTYMMKQAVTGPSGGTRVFNYEPFNTLALAGTPCYWTWWAYYPSAISFGPSDSYLPWGIMGHRSDDTYNPIWNLVFHGSDNSLDLVYSPNNQAPDPGPHSNESGKRYYFSGVSVPVGSWVRFEVMIKSSDNTAFNGALKVWMNGALLFDLSSIVTRYPTWAHSLVSYIEQTGYGSNLTPTPCVVYVDDVTLSLGRMPQ